MSITCFECQHFFVTWDKDAPRGCKAYGFKGVEIPSIAVLHTTGMACQLGRKKEVPKDVGSKKQKKQPDNISSYLIRYFFCFLWGNRSEAVDLDGIYFSKSYVHSIPDGERAALKHLLQDVHLAFVRSPDCHLAGRLGSHTKGREKEK